MRDPNSRYRMGVLSDHLEAFPEVIALLRLSMEIIDRNAVLPLVYRGIEKGELGSVVDDLRDFQAEPRQARGPEPELSRDRRELARFLIENPARLIRDYENPRIRRFEE